MAVPVIGARDKSKPQSFKSVSRRRRGDGSADATSRLPAHKSVPVRPSRLEPGNVGMHGEAKLRIGNRLAALLDATLRVIISDLISDRDGYPAHSIDAA